MGQPRVAVIGAGRVGAGFALALRRAGRPVASVSSRTAAGARRAARLAGAPALPPAAAAARAGVILLSVPDDAIRAAARALAPSVRRGTVVAHTAGALSSDALAVLRRRGARTASLHPLMTFPTPDRGAAALPGSFVFLEGHPAAVRALSALVRSVGAIPVRVPRTGKVLYHAGAVLACNALVALLAEAFALFRAAGIPAGTTRRALGPLVRRTVDNVFALGPARALTGPVARGDAGTVARHLAALPPAPRATYLALARATLRIARIPPRPRAALASALRPR